MKTGKSAGEKTLLASVLLSLPGPLAMGAGLLLGRSATQIADFLRRTVELLAIVFSLAMYRRIRFDESRRAKLERLTGRLVGHAMCVGGTAMAAMAVWQIFSPSTRKGNAIVGLIIALLGVVTNTWFWLRYARLGRQTADRILNVQARLYRAKAMVDFGVCLALSAVTFAPASPVTPWMDTGGTFVVAFYLLLSGTQTVREKRGAESP